MAAEARMDRQAAAAILFGQYGMYAMDAMSTLNSSPWTAENFGGDPEKAKSCREYVLHAIGIGAVYAIAGTAIAGSWWPLLGWAGVAAYLWWLYDRALRRAVASGSTSWE